MYLFLLYMFDLWLLDLFIKDMVIIGLGVVFSLDYLICFYFIFGKDVSCFEAF